MDLNVNDIVLFVHPSLLKQKGKKPLLRHTEHFRMSG